MAYTGKSTKVINYNDEDVQLDPMDHKSEYGEYGVGNSTEYGHLKLSDSTSSTSGVNDGVAATPKAVNDAITGAGISGLTADRLIKSSSATSVTSMAAMTANHIIQGNGSTVSAIQTKNGALYATATNGAAQFGTLPVAQGGTGATTSAAARTNLGVAASSHNHAAGDINSGTLGVARGGTGTSSFTANQVVISGASGTAALTTRAIATSISSTTSTSIATEGIVASALSGKVSVTVSGNTLVFSI